MGFSFKQLRDRDGASHYHCDRDTVSRGLNGSILLTHALDSVPSEAVTVSNCTVGQVKDCTTGIQSYCRQVNIHAK